MSVSSGNSRKPLITPVDSLRVKKLKEEVESLRMRSEMDVKKIKCLQGKLRRISAKKGKHKVENYMSLGNESGGKSGRKPQGRKAKMSETVSAKSQSPSSFCSSVSVNFDEEIQGTMEIKIEPEVIQEDLPLDDTGLAGPTAATDDSELHEDMIYYPEVKTEIPVDPLSVDVSALQNEVPVEGSQRTCDAGFVPARSHSLPRVGSLAVADCLAAARKHGRESLLAVTKQAIEDLDDSIGFVQLRRDGDTCTVKCTVADGAGGAAYACALVYAGAEDAVRECVCECGRARCLHALTAVLWLHYRLEGPEDVSLWCEPAAQLPGAAGALEAAGAVEAAGPRDQNDNTVLEQFLMMCLSNNNFSPGVMRYYCEDERTKCSLHKLACKYLEMRGEGPAGFLSFCQSYVTDKDYAAAAIESLQSFAFKREITYGRITEETAWQISEEPARHLDAILDAIIYPDDRQNADEIPEAIVDLLEKNMDIDVKKSGTVVDLTTPVLAVTPYGTTPTHVVHMEKLINGVTVEKGGKVTAAVQMQMHVANKQFAYVCHFSDEYLDVTVVKRDRVYCERLLEKCVAFWTEHVFERIAIK